MPYATVFCGTVGCFLGLFVGVTCAVIVGWPGLLFWPAITFSAAVIGFCCDIFGGKA